MILSNLTPPSAGLRPASADGTADARRVGRRLRGLALNLVLRVEAALRVAHYNRTASDPGAHAGHGRRTYRIARPAGSTPASAEIQAYGYASEVREREWADLAVHDGSPGHASHSDLLYLPGGHAFPQSGLYDREGRPVPETIVHRGLTRMNGLAEVAPWDAGPEFAIETRPAIYLGHISSFGHFLTETLSLAWVKEVSGLDDPIWVHHGKDPHARSWGEEIMGHLGIPRARVVRYDAPTILRNVLVPRPALRLNDSIWTVFPQMAATLSDRILGKTRPARTDQPLYLSRERLGPRQRIHGNEKVLARWLASRGARILHPQALPLVEQVCAINAHSTVIGPVGSAHHLNVLAREPARHVYLAPSLGPQTYMLIDAAKGNDSHWIQAEKLDSWWKRGKSAHLQNTVIHPELTRRVLTDLGI